MQEPGSFVSTETSDRVTGAFGSAGRRWLAELPGTLKALLREHNLRPQSPIEASYGYVLCVSGPDGSDLVLKCAPPSDELRREAAVLRAWRGRCGAPSPTGSGLFTMQMSRLRSSVLGTMSMFFVAVALLPTPGIAAAASDTLESSTPSVAGAVEVG